MSAIRTQYITQTPATIAGTPTPTVVDLIRPMSAAGVPYVENTDYVTLPRQDVSSESGMVVIDLGTVIGVAAALLTGVEVWQSYAPAQSGLGSAMFPSGSAPSGNGASTLVRSVFASTAGLACNSALIAGILGSPLATPAFPGIELLASQFVKLSFLNTGAALAASSITAKYDLGVNAVEYRKL
jgi:hypothetical protein